MVLVFIVKLESTNLPASITITTDKDSYSFNDSVIVTVTLYGVTPLYGRAVFIWIKKADNNASYYSDNSFTDVNGVVVFNESRVNIGWPTASYKVRTKVVTSNPPQEFWAEKTISVDNPYYVPFKERKERCRIPQKKEGLTDEDLELCPVEIEYF